MHLISHLTLLSAEIEMGSSSVCIGIALFWAVLVGTASLANAQLSEQFYDETCPRVRGIVRAAVKNASRSDPRIGASIIRLHFHDCFVLGCDGSILLDNSSSIETEKDAFPNKDSARGFEVIDNIKKAVDAACPRTVSCADILTIAAGASVRLAGGPSWKPLLGRRDGFTANKSIANTDLPGPQTLLPRLISMFAAKGLNSTDLVALSGAHTFGRAQCQFFSDRLYDFNNTGRPDPTLDPTYRAELRQICPNGGNGSVLANLDHTTPNDFDNKYYTNLLNQEGLLQSDQELFSTPGAQTAAVVNNFASSEKAFFRAFVRSMKKMGNIEVLTGTQGEVRLNCRRVNARSLGSLGSSDSEDLVSSI